MGATSTRPLRARTGRMTVAFTMMASLATGCSKEGASAATDSLDAAPPRSTAASVPPGGRSASAPPAAVSASPRVTLSQAAFAGAGIAVEPARGESAATMNAGLDVPGQIALDPSRVAIISSRAAGRIERLTAVEGDHVGMGQTVALLSSPVFLVAQSDLLQAHRRAEVLAGTADAPGAVALVGAARRRLALLGASPEVIRRLEAGAEPSLYLSVGAPFDGTILEAKALAGTAVEPGGPLFRIGDLSAVDIVADVPERALGAVHPGLGASASVTAFPTTPFAGRVLRVRDEVDSTTRTVKALIRVANTERKLRPGMFVTVRITVPVQSTLPGLTSASSLVSILETAVITDGDQQYVFVEVGVRTYERRQVDAQPVTTPGTPLPGPQRVLVRRGLTTGERVVVRGAFSLKSELGKAGRTDDG